jgi:tetratricopeptide (TPR) repeat protein
MLTLPHLLSAAAVLLLLTPEAPIVIQAVVPETPDPESAACVAAVGDNVEAGREAAIRWASEGGGAPAQHCLAVADLAAGFPKSAAIRLEELAERSDAGDALVRARILSQAALAWVEAREPLQADRTIEKAFALAPDAGELFLAAAKVYAANDRQQATIDAVTSAEDAGFVSADGYVLRARAHFLLAQYRRAAEDVVEALKIDSFNLDALVLRGELAQAGIAIDADYQRVEDAKSSE